MMADVIWYYVCTLFANHDHFVPLQETQNYLQKGC